MSLATPAWMAPPANIAAVAGQTSEQRALVRGDSSLTPKALQISRTDSHRDSVANHQWSGLEATAVGSTVLWTIAWSR